MSVKNVHIIGCSPQSKYVVEILTLLKVNILGIYDPVGEKVGTFIDQHRVLDYGDFEMLLNNPQKQSLDVAICLRDNRLKESLYINLASEVNLINCFHPGSHIAQDVKVGQGNIVNAGAIIQPQAEIGNGCMIHAGVVIEHDNVIGDFVNIAPGVIMAGGVRVGERTTINTGAVIGPNVRIGKDCLVGAGSLLLKDVPDNVVVHGHPARIIKQRND